MLRYITVCYVLLLVLVSADAVPVFAQNQPYIFNQFTLPYQNQYIWGLAVASGDFNRDGNTDFAVATQPNALGIQIILGKPDGTLQTGAFLTMNGGTETLENLVTGDFNKDHKLDIVVWDATASQYVLFVGNGDGTFQPGTYIAPGYYGTALVAVDVNKDGNLDLIAGENYNGKVQVILGNGDGTFQTPAPYFAGSGAVTSLAVGDINKDGKLDFAALSGGTVYLFEGVGNGTFNSPTTLQPPTNYPSSVAIADLNGDKKSDVIVGASGGVDVFLGNGDGTFQPVKVTSSPGGPYQLATGDVNGDGKVDVVALTGYSVSVLLGKGDGTFRTPIRSFAAGYNPGNGDTTLLLGDFNHDGRLDIATMPEDGTLIALYAGNGDGTFAAGGDIIGMTGSQYIGVAAGDFNHDGKQDFAAVNTGTNRVEIYLGNGRGTFHLAYTYPVGNSPQQIVAGDFNNDNKLDLAVTNQSDNTVSVLLGNGNGSFQAQKTYIAGPYPYGIAAADFNHDGHLDLAVNTEGNPSVSVLLGKGDGTFNAATSWGGPGMVQATLAVADFNADGNTDIVATQAGSAALNVLWGNGDGTFPTSTGLSDYANGHYAVAAPALEGSLPDIVFGTLGGLYVVPNLGINGFGTPFYYSTYQLEPYALTTGDFNGDGKIDIAGGTANQPGAGLTLLLGNGDHTLNSARDYQISNSYYGYSYGIAVADFNSDGLPDVVLPNTAGTITTILSNPIVVFSSTGVNFGSVKVGTSVSQAVSVTNQSNVPLKVTSISVTGTAAADYKQSNSCDSVVQPQGTCSVTVTFTPSVIGTRSAILKFTDSQSGPARTISLTGKGS